MIVVMVAVVVMIISRWLDTRIVRRAREISRVRRHAHAINEGGVSGEARLLRIWTQRPAAGGRGINKPTRNVISDHLVRRGVKVYARRIDWSRRGTVLNPIFQRGQ